MHVCRLIFSAWYPKDFEEPPDQEWFIENAAELLPLAKLAPKCNLRWTYMHLELVMCIWRLRCCLQQSHISHRKMSGWLARGLGSSLRRNFLKILERTTAIHLYYDCKVPTRRAVRWICIPLHSNMHWTSLKRIFMRLHNEHNLSVPEDNQLDMKTISKNAADDATVLRCIHYHVPNLPLKYIPYRGGGGELLKIIEDKDTPTITNCLKVLGDL